VTVLAVMFTLEWRLTFISIAILPFFLVAARKLGNRLRDVARLQLDLNAKMNAVLNELLNISGALLVKLFGRTAFERVFEMLDLPLEIAEKPGAFELQ